MKKTSRRKFVVSAATISAGSMLAAPSLNKLFAAENNIPSFGSIGFEQQPLQYEYNALEPNIDAQTMEIHYTKHAAAYTKNLNEAVEAEIKDKDNISLEKIFAGISKYSAKMRNNAGGHYNHELFWKTLTPKATQPSTKFNMALTKNFDSIDEFKKQFATAAKNRFGSGWAWLVLNNEKKLVISSTPNQDNPLMSVAEVKGTPIFGLDVWEHAYYLYYQNRRADYIDSFWNVINWEFVSERYEGLV